MSAQPDTPFTVVVEIRDPDGDVCANGEADVPCIISLDTIPDGVVGAVLTGTLTKTPSAGVLTFDDLQINRTGNGWKLKVETVDPIDDDASLASLVSASFTVSSNTLTAVLTDTDTYGKTPTLGSVSPGDLGLGATVRTLTFYNDGMGTQVVTLGVSGAHGQFDLFVSMTVGGFTYYASGVTSFSGFNTWVWENQGSGVNAAGDFSVEFA